MGFAAGRFPFSNIPYGFFPKNEFESTFWPILKNKYFQQAAEIFVRLLSENELSSDQLTKLRLAAEDFRSEKDFKTAQKLSNSNQTDFIEIAPHWQFAPVGVIPFEYPRELLQLTIGSHDPQVQSHVNRFMPVGVFNLSITPAEVIEKTHLHMTNCYHQSGGPWLREYMPRTLMVFINKDAKKAKEQAERAWRNYWTAMEGTLDPQKVKSAVENTVAGEPQEVLEKIIQKYHPQDKLMLWFDFNNHDNEEVKSAMKLFTERVRPQLPI
jgi:hypothetical protein